MSYKITIVYTGPAVPIVNNLVSTIAREYTPGLSYIDTPAYEGTVYDTNVDGFGDLPAKEPYASTSFPFPVPLAQFKLAIVGEDDETTGGKKVEFTVDSFMEAMWYKEAGKELESQGFTVTVTEVAA